MSASSLYDTGAPTIEVRIYSDGVLLTRELCESEEEAQDVVERYSDVANLFVVADDLGTPHTPDDVLAPEPPITDPWDEEPIASRPVSPLGTE